MDGVRTDENSVRGIPTKRPVVRWQAAEYDTDAENVWAIPRLIWIDPRPRRNDRDGSLVHPAAIEVEVRGRVVPLVIRASQLYLLEAFMEHQPQVVRVVRRTEAR